MWSVVPKFRKFPSINYYIIGHRLITRAYRLSTTKRNAQDDRVENNYGILSFAYYLLCITTAKWTWKYPSTLWLRYKQAPGLHIVVCHVYFDIVAVGLRWNRTSISIIFLYTDFLSFMIFGVTYRSVLSYKQVFYRRFNMPYYAVVMRSAKTGIIAEDR